MHWSDYFNSLNLDDNHILQDQIEPFSFAEVEQIVESELNVRISKAFQEFEATPIAAASLGQVHRAVLRDGREVVVKVQRPNIRATIRKDLEVFADIAATLEQRTAIGRKMNLSAQVEQLRTTILNELDYLQEMHNAQVLRRNLAEFEEIYVPAPVPDMTTTRVLTTELVPGRKISRLSALAHTENDFTPLARVITHAYLKQICVDGFWHSDPHPGNVFLWEGQLVLLDFGMVSRLPGDLQDLFIKLLLGITQNRGRDVAEVCIKLGTPQEGFEYERFVRDVSMLVTSFQHADLRRTNVGQLIFQVIQIANSDELQVPSELALLGKTLLHLDTITRTLDPDFDAKETIEEYAERLMVKKVRQRTSPRNYYGALLDLNQLAIELPTRTREVLEQVSRGKLTFTVNVGQAQSFIKAMQRIANRITVGLVIAALLIASSLMMRAPSREFLLGYPLFAVLGYVIAAGLGIYLVVTILMTDRSDRRKADTNR